MGTFWRGSVSDGISFFPTHAFVMHERVAVGAILADGGVCHAWASCGWCYSGRWSCLFVFKWFCVLLPCGVYLTMFFILRKVLSGEAASNTQSTRVLPTQAHRLCGSMWPSKFHIYVNLHKTYLQVRNFLTVAAYVLQNLRT